MTPGKVGSTRMTVLDEALAAMDIAENELRHAQKALGAAAAHLTRAQSGLPDLGGRSGPKDVGQAEVRIATASEKVAGALSDLERARRAAEQVTGPT